MCRARCEVLSITPKPHVKRQQRIAFCTLQLVGYWFYHTVRWLQYNSTQTAQRAIGIRIVQVEYLRMYEWYYSRELRSQPTTQYERQPGGLSIFFSVSSFFSTRAAVPQGFLSQTLLRTWPRIIRLKTSVGSIKVSPGISAESTWTAACNPWFLTRDYRRRFSIEASPSLNCNVR